MFSIEHNITTDEVPYRLHYHVPIAASQTTGGAKRMVREHVADLVAFLAVTHSMSLFMSFDQWENHLDPLGAGAKGEVRQRFLDLRKSLAFKRPRSINHSRNVVQHDIPKLVGTYDDVFLDGEYRVLMSEVMTLCSEGVRHHPNIINLEGLCWDFQKDTNEVWPVLIFEKAEKGDLATFLNSPEGRALGTKKRLHLCQDVVIAVVALHRYGIVHGDINPRNLLVFPDKDDVYLKLSDFGYSALMHRGDRIDMARTPPWHAPECDNQWSFDFEDARLTDIYSLGLVCLYILFNESFRDDHVVDATFNKLNYQWIEELRRTGNLSNSAESLAEGMSEFEAQQLEALKDFFGCSLAGDPGKRTLSLYGLFYEHAQRTDIGKIAFDSIQPQFYAPQTAPYAAQFKLSKIWWQSMRGDFRLRLAIVEALVRQERSHPMETCRSNAAIQLAVCLALGFGCTRSTSKAKEWLKRASATEDDLETEIKYIEAMDRYHEAGDIRGWEGSYGADTYNSDSLLQAGLQAHREAITDLEYTLSGTHLMILEQKMTVANILERLGKTIEAYHIISEVISACRTYHTRNTNALCRALRQNMTVCNTLGFWDELKHSILEERDIQDSIRQKTIRSSWLANLPPNYLQIHHYKLLGICSFREGKIQEAEELLLRCIREGRAKYGITPYTVSVMTDLAALYTFEARIEAKDFILQTMDLYEELGDGDIETRLRLRILLARAHDTRGEAKTAISLAVQSLHDCRKLLGAHHSETLSAIQTLAGIYDRRGHIKEACALYETQLTILQSIYGDDKPVTAWSRMNLAKSTFLGGEETETQWVQGLNVLSKALGEGHPGVAGNRAGLTQFLKWRAFWRNVDKVIPRWITVGMGRRVIALEAWFRRHWYA